MAVISAFKLLTWILFAVISEARATAHGAHRHNHPRAAVANGLPKACPDPVVLPDNAFKNRQLYATPYYAAKVAASVKNIADADLARRAAMIGDVGTFMWMFVSFF